MRQSGDHSDIVVGCLEIVYRMPLFPLNQTGKKVPENLALQNESLIQLKNSPGRCICTLAFSLKHLELRVRSLDTLGNYPCTVPFSAKDYVTRDTLKLLLFP